MPRAMLLGVALLLAACVTTVSQAYLPETGRDRFSLAEAQDALDQMVAVECPRLVKAQHDLGDAKITVDVDGSGDVTKSTLSKPFGDERMNKIFGGVTAQMHFDAPSDGKPSTGHMRVGYSCGASSSTATIQLL